MTYIVLGAVFWMVVAFVAAIVKNLMAKEMEKSAIRGSIRKFLAKI
jgi:hypothetical protein